jgi:hypothetical protein
MQAGVLIDSGKLIRFARFCEVIHMPVHGPIGRMHPHVHGTHDGFCACTLLVGSAMHPWADLMNHVLPSLVAQGRHFASVGQAVRVALVLRHALAKYIPYIPL